MRPSADDLRRVLPGTWRILATTFPLWLNGKRLQPTITYTLLPGDRLALRDEVDYRTRGGARRRVIGIDHYDPGTGWFTWRGHGLLIPLSSRWRVDNLISDGRFAVLTFGRSLITPAGIDILGRGSEAHPGAQDRLSPDVLGLTIGQFSALTWL
ncbi:hypothetical protein OG563_46820 [Nocardia vinacea]|uniref:Uncharacterized protein n=1 Tax=Nocardia vinacea TaxID=96468 RepID=A0ABZ1YX73_9NOCA|nr:hypothetical protein [Nocardia vinacea]